MLNQTICSHLLYNLILQAKGVIEGVKTTFIERLKQLDWMDEATKRKGTDKVC